MYHHLIREGETYWRLWLGHRPQLHVELNLFSWNFGIGLEVEGGGSDDDVMFTLSLLLFSLYVGVSARWLRRLCDFLLKGSYEPRDISIRIFAGALWWNLWAPSHSWSSSQPKWMSGSWNPMDWAFGRMEHVEVGIVSTTDTFIPMPEKAYPCVVVMKDELWKRKRLPWPSARIIRAHIDCKEGVPFPGKGESAWDCGDDASHGLCCPAKTIEEGIAKFVESVLRSRRRYGGSVNWRQKAVAA